MKKIIYSIVIATLTGALSAQKFDKHYQRLHGANKVESRKEIRIPDILGYKTLKCDFHMHTIFSDGRVLPQERVNEAWREGLDAIAITDHTTPVPSHIKGDYNSPYTMALPTAKNKGITLIKGIEFTKSKPIGHLNFLFIDDGNLYGDPTNITADEALELASSKGAYIVYNHPGWPDKNSDLFDFQIKLMKEKKIHAIEVVNGNEFYPIAMDYCYTYELSPFSTTDIHAPIQVDYDTKDRHRNLTLVLAKDNDEESIREALFAGRTVAYSDNTLIGREKYLKEILKEALVVSKYNENASMFSCYVTNTSDITFYLDGPNHTRITFPANRTVQLKEEMRNYNTIYEVTNTYTSSNQHIIIPLNYILTDRNEVSMPYINQDLSSVSVKTPIEVFCPTSGADIRYTIDGTEPTSASPSYDSPFRLTKSSKILLKAFNEGMRPSRVYSIQAVLDVPHSSTPVSGLKKGVAYKYYEGEFVSVYEIESKGKFVKEGIITDFDLLLAQAEDYFGIVFTGYLYAPVDGVYQFATQSDDGSTFRISGVDLINNDGSHSLTKVSGSIRLKKGYHPYELRYLEDYEGQELHLLWTAPGKEEEPIGEDRLFIK